MATNWDSKIKSLNKKLCKSGKELNDCFAELVEASRQKALDYVIIAIFKAYPNVVLRTPVATGRARAAWQISVVKAKTPPSEGEYEQYKNNAIAEAMSEIKRQELSLRSADVIYIMNNVDYIMGLEAGFSRQGSGFIALMIEELKQQLQGLIKAVK